MPPKGERRKQQIIDTAKEMFISKGFQSTHIGQICEELDIARGTVYQYFSNKKEILYALLDAVIEKIEDFLDQDDLKDYLSTNPAKDDVIILIKNRIYKIMEVFFDEPIVIKLIFKDIVGIDSEVVTKVEDSIQKIKIAIGREVTELKKQGYYKPTVNEKTTSSMLVGGIMMIIYEHHKALNTSPDKQIIDSITNCYLEGTINR